MAGKRLWKTEPLDCWQKAKEFRRNNYSDIATAEERGALVALGGAGIEQGLGPCHHITGEAYGASCANLGASQEFGEAAEARGFARDVCAYMRVNLGSMYLNKYAFGGPFPKVDFALRTSVCDTQSKWSLLMSEYAQVPYFCIDGAIRNEYDSEQSKDNKIEYVIEQTLDAIEWAEKTTGRKFDDETYIQGLYNSSRSRNLWGQVVLLNQNIPAPLDEKTLFSLYIVTFLGSEKPEAIELMQMLRDEVEHRVRNEIAAVATERYRIMHMSNPPWYALNIFRYMQKYGAVSIGSRYTFTLGGGTMMKGGLEIPHPTLQEQGIVIKSREDAVRATITQRRLNEGMGGGFRYCGPESRDCQVRLAKLWHCDGAILHFNRGCEGFSLGEPQVRLALLENNIPVLTYEGNVADSREWDEARTMARLDSFMESQGLEKLDD